jgi:uncharacterized membrane protein SirB2
MSYLTLKYVHVACVVTSYAFFFVRGVWMMRDSPLLTRRWVKIMPHVVDTLLLASAIALALLIRQYPFSAPWLTAKVLGLVVYIGLGMLALSRGKTKRARITAWIAAQAVFLYILAVARTKNAIPFVG